jgi:hypothetical protein
MIQGVDQLSYDLYFLFPIEIKELLNLELSDAVSEVTHEKVMNLSNHSSQSLQKLNHHRDLRR